jgi:hypothetical protein
MTESLSTGQTDQNALHEKVREIANGIARTFSPKTLILIAVDHWFGSRWLHFSGKAHGAFGVWTKPLSIPPFVPARVLSQRRFLSPDYVETEPGDPLHIEASSSAVIRRKLAQIAADTAVLWYSADSATTGQLSVMAYIPSNAGYVTWYAALQKRGDEVMIGSFMSWSTLAMSSSGHC